MDAYAIWTKEAPMIYQQLVDNALWGYVQPKGSWQDFATKIKVAEDELAVNVQLIPQSLTKKPREVHR